MKLLVTLANLTVASSILLGPAAQAQFVKGNEAVKVTADGHEGRDTAAARHRTHSVNEAVPCYGQLPCRRMAMVETADGLLECTEAYARPGTCRASTYGDKKLSRLWVVKRGAEWLQCQYPDLGSKCVNMFARPPANLPFSAVQ